MSGNVLLSLYILSINYGLVYSLSQFGEMAKETWHARAISRRI